MVVHFKLYTKAGCHLCEDMMHQLDELSSQLDFSIESVYIENQNDLQEQFGTIIPVLTYRDKIVCESFLDKKVVERIVSQVSVEVRD